MQRTARRPGLAANILVTALAAGMMAMLTGGMFYNRQEALALLQAAWAAVMGIPTLFMLAWEWAGEELGIGNWLIVGMAICIVTIQFAPVRRKLNLPR